MSDSLELLLDRARKGDRSAFEAVVRRYLPAVHEIVARTSKGRGVPESLVAESFHRAWRGLAGLSPRADFGRWLGGIARYVAHEAARRREPFAVARSRRDPGDRPETVFGALARLPEEPREALLRRHLDGLDRAGAARDLGIDAEELDARLRVGRETLAGDAAPDPTAGPDCEEVRRLVSLEIDRALEEDRRSRFSGHLLACAGCSRRRERLRSVAVRLDAACLPIREEAAEIVGAIGDRRPGQETVPVRPPWRALWGVLAAVLVLLALALIAAAARSA
jgi:RNA polymerase sigma-70 factor (ECF subfamily)